MGHSIFPEKSEKELDLRFALAHPVKFRREGRGLKLGFIGHGQGETLMVNKGRF